MDGVYRAKFFLDIKNYHKEAKLLFIFIYIGKDRAPLRASENLIFGQPERFPRYVLLPPSVGIYTFIYLPLLVASTCLIIIELSPSCWAPGACTASDSIYKCPAQTNLFWGNRDPLI